MIKSETITAKIKNRILVTDAPIFSGEAVRFRLDFEIGEADASEHKIILFGDDKTALAEARFTAFGGAWFANLNTATNEMAAYFADVPIDATKSIGAMVVNTIKSDVITRGNVLVVSTPFPDDLAPCPQTYTYLTTEEFSSSMAEVESEISGKADESDFIQLSSTVADLESEVDGLGAAVADMGEAVDGKADAAELAALANEVAAKVDYATFDALASNVANQGGAISDLSQTCNALANDKADSSTVADLSSTVASKAESSTVAALSSAVAALPYVKTIIPETEGRTITFNAESRHVYGVAPYGDNEQISVTFPQPTNQIYDCIIDADCREAESSIIILFANTSFCFKAVGGILQDLATLDPGEMYRLYLTQTAFVSDGKPVVLVSRKQL